MKNKNYYCVIMAGGVGSRFWPVSTAQHPKQFHDVLGIGKTLIQQTFERINKIICTENIYVITNEEYVGITLAQLPKLTPLQVVGEPKMMNTAACNIYMAEKINKINPDSSLIIIPSDHLILEEDLFLKDVLIAFSQAEKEKVLVTLGIKPVRPETGFGYIEFNKKNKKGSLYKVDRFKEKPDLETAKIFIQSKNYLWNSGIFIWSTKTILNEFSIYLSEMYKIFEGIKAFYNTIDEKEKILEIYSKIPNISIDYGILEKSQNIWVIPTSFTWSDLGSWSALYESSEKDENGNAVFGNQVHLYYTSNSIIKEEQKDKILIIDGLNEYIVADTKEALLICPKNKDQILKDYLNEINKRKK